MTDRAKEIAEGLHRSALSGWTVEEFLSGLAPSTIHGFDVRKIRAGDLFTIDGIEVGRVSKTEGDLTTMGCTVHIIPSLLYFALVLAYKARLEQLPLHLTNQTMPGHDPPVAWMVEDHPLARLGFPVIAAPGYRHPEPVAAGAATYMRPEPMILDSEPGQRP